MNQPKKAPELPKTPMASHQLLLPTEKRLKRLTKLLKMKLPMISQKIKPLMML
jgi:hypothetical protein